MYVKPEPDGTWKSECYAMLLNLFKQVKYVTIISQKKMEDGYMGCIYIGDIDVSRQLKNEGVVNSFQIKYVHVSYI